MYIIIHITNPKQNTAVVLLSKPSDISPAWPPGRTSFFFSLKLLLVSTSQFLIALVLMAHSGKQTVRSSKVVFTSSVIHPRPSLFSANLIEMLAAVFSIPTTKNKTKQKRFH